MTFFNVYTPANTELFYNLIINMAEFDLFDTSSIIRFLFPFIQYSSDYDEEVTEETLPDEKRRL